MDDQGWVYLFHNQLKWQRPDIGESRSCFHPFRYKSNSHKTQRYYIHIYNIIYNIALIYEFGRRSRNTRAILLLACDSINFTWGDIDHVGGSALRSLGPPSSLLHLCKILHTHEYCIGHTVGAWSMQSRPHKTSPVCRAEVVDDDCWQPEKREAFYLFFRLNKAVRKNTNKNYPTISNDVLYRHCKIVITLVEDKWCNNVLI